MAQNAPIALSANIFIIYTFRPIGRNYKKPNRSNAKLFRHCNKVRFKSAKFGVMEY